MVNIEPTPGFGAPQASGSQVKLGNRLTLSYVIFRSTGFGQPMERSKVNVSQVFAAVLKANISVDSAAFAQSSNLRRIGAPATGEYTSTVIVISVAEKATGVSRQAFGPVPTEVPAQQSVPGGLVTHKTGLLASVGSAPITADV